LKIIVNHLELFSIIFGAKFVFKLLAKYAFKNILENSQKPCIFSFCFPIQNLGGIFSWSLKQSCRGLNSKQLLFLGHFQKRSFSPSPLSHFLPPPAPARLRRVPTTAGIEHPVAAMRRLPAALGRLWPP
jgi:hypothetical protein